MAGIEQKGAERRRSGRKDFDGFRKKGAESKPGESKKPTENRSEPLRVGKNRLFSLFLPVFRLSVSAVSVPLIFAFAGRSRY